MTCVTNGSNGGHSSELTEPLNPAADVASSGSDSSRKSLARSQRFDDTRVVVDRRDPQKLTRRRRWTSLLIFPWRLMLWLLAWPTVCFLYPFALLEEQLTERPVRETFTGAFLWRLFIFMNCIRVCMEYPLNEDFYSLRDSPILVANHTGYMDGAILATVLFRPRVVLVQWVMKMPIIGNMVRQMRCIAVNTADAASRAQSLERILTHCREWQAPPMPKAAHRESLIEPMTKPRIIEQERGFPEQKTEDDSWDNRPYWASQSLLLFPEGICCNGERLGIFRKGAFVPGLPVRPVVALWTAPDGWCPGFPDYRRMDVLHPDFGASLEPGSEHADWGQFSSQVEEDLYKPESVIKTINCNKYDPRAVTRHTPMDICSEYSFSEWLYNLLSQPYVTLHVKCLPIYHPTQNEIDDPELYAANVQRHMQLEFQIQRLKYAQWRQIK